MDSYASRPLTEAELRYAQIEKESFAITFMESRSLVGPAHRLVFKVDTDHKPLMPLFPSKLIDELPIRIQRFKMRLIRYCKSCV